MSTEKIKIIMGFMGIKPVECFGKFSISKDHCTSTNNTAEETLEGFASIAKYSSSWDWLMPVFEKLQSMGYPFEISSNCVKIYSLATLMGDLLGEEPPMILMIRKVGRRKGAKDQDLKEVAILALSEAIEKIKK